MKKLFLPLLALSLFAFVFTACSNTTTPDPILSEPTSSGTTDSGTTDPGTTDPENKTFKITYSISYGSVKDTTLTSTDGKFTEALLPVPEFDDFDGGVEFLGWSTNGVTFKQVKPGDSITKDIKLFAFYNYKEITYCLDYNLPEEKKDISKIKCIGYLHLNIKDYSVIPENYSLAGWNTEKDGSGVNYEKGSNYRHAKYTEETVTFYAQWSLLADFDISYDVSGYGKKPENVKAKRGSLFTEEMLAPPDVSEEDGSKIFKGWSMSSDNTIIYPGLKIQKDSVLHAVWEIKTFNIIFNSNNSLNKTETKNYDVLNQKSLSSIYSFKEKDYAFVEWNTKIDGSGEKYSNSPIGMENYREEITLYAIWKWSPAEYFVYFVYVNYDKPGDTYTLQYVAKTNENADSFTEYDDYTFVPAKIDGYVFEGWYTDSSCILYPITGWKAGEKTASITVYGKFEKRKGYAKCNVKDIFVYDEDAIKIKYEYNNIMELSIKCNGQEVPSDKVESGYGCFIVSGLERGTNYNFEIVPEELYRGYEYDSENSSVTASLSIPTDCFVIPVDELSDTVNAMAANTVDTPYAICVARLNDGIYEHSEGYSVVSLSKLYNTLSSEVKKIDGRYIDLRKTTLPAVESYSALFQNKSRNSVSNEFIPVEDQDFKALVYAPAIPDGAIDLSYMFDGCLNLKEAPQMPDTVENLTFTFYDCINLETIPNFSTNATKMDFTCYNCVKLETIPEFGDAIETMKYTFQDCTSLTNAPDFSSTLITAPGTYSNTKITTLPALPEGCTEMDYICSGCKELTTVENIPSTVVNIAGSFNKCSKLAVIENWDVGDTFNISTSATTYFIGFATETLVSSLKIYCDTEVEKNRLNGFIHNSNVKYYAFDNVYVSAEVKTE